MGRVRKYSVYPDEADWLKTRRKDPRDPQWTPVDGKRVVGRLQAGRLVRERSSSMGIRILDVEGWNLYEESGK